MISPWLYQSRAGAKRKPETDTARVISCIIPILGQYFTMYDTGQPGGAVMSFVSKKNDCI